MDLIENRRSIRKYKEQHIPNEVLKKILEAGRLAPSWMNVQPWHFILVRKNKEILSELSHNQPHVKNADAVIVCVADVGGWNRERFGKILKEKGIQDSGIDAIFQIPAYYPPLLGEQTALLRTVEQVTYALAYMTLEAEKQGIACCVIGAIGNEVTQTLPELSQKVKQTLNLNDEQCIISMLTLGYSDDDKPTPKLRKDFDEVISEETLGQKFIV